MMIVGITGGIGSGKSTVAGFFRELGVPVYNSDKEAKILMVESQKLRTEIVQLFGEKAYTGEKLNRRHISALVFREKKKLDQLNRIVHPAVREHFLQWVSQQSSAYVIQETALIFELGTQDNYDAIVLVTSPKNVRIQRVMKRDDVSEEQIKVRIANQMSDIYKMGHADFTIDNHDFLETKKAVGTIHKKLLARALP